jgi:iron complex outermembrane receptor protein
MKSVEYSTVGKYALAFLFLILAFDSFCQSKVTGRVLDEETQAPLPYANVVGRTYSTVTDVHGDFSLTTDESQDTLSISYIGYEEIQITVTLQPGRHQLGNIFLKPVSEQLNTVTITSGKFRKRIEDVTVSMEILKPTLLEQSHVQSFNEILDKIPGVSNIDGQVNIRGGSGYAYGAGSRVLLLIDNLPALTSDASFANWTDIPVESIAQIEVLKGAGSALYGSAAMNGVINILTKYAKKKAAFNIQVQGQAYLSPSDSIYQWWDSPPYRYNISSSFSKKFGKLSLVAGGFITQLKSFRKDSYNDYGRLNVKLDYSIRDNIMAGISGNLNTGKSSSFFYWKDHRAGAYLADSVNYSHSTKTRYTIDPHITYLGPGDLTLRLQGRISRIQNESDNDQSNFLTSWFREVQVQKKWKPVDLVMTGGWVSQYAIVDAPLYSDTIFQSVNHAFYMQFEKKFFERLTLNAGSRYEINKINGPKVVNGEPAVQDEFEGKPVFRAGMNYKLFDYTNFRASWGQGYRYPSIAEKYITTKAGILNIVPNPALGSETGWTAEIGIRQGFGIKNLKGFLDLSAFQSQYNDMIEFKIRENSPWPPQFAAYNIGNTVIKGLETTCGISASIHDFDWNFQGGYLYLDPKYRDFTEAIKILSSSEENILKYRNKHAFKFNSSFSFRGFELGFGVDYKSQTEAIDRLLSEAIKGVKKFREEHSDGTQIWYANAGINYKHWTFSVRVDNLLNTAYSIRPAQLEAPRSISVKLKYSL